MSERIRGSYDDALYKSNVSYTYLQCLWKATQSDLFKNSFKHMSVFIHLVCILSSVILCAFFHILILSLLCV